MDYLKINNMKKIATRFLLWLPILYSLLLSTGLQAQCGPSPVSTPGTILCNGQQTNVVITLNLLGGPYNIQPYMDYQFPGIPIAPFATNYMGSAYTINGLGAGTYTIYVVDVGHGNCYDSTMFTLTEPAILNFTQGIQFPWACADLAPSSFGIGGGTPPYLISYTQDNLNFSTLTSTSSTTYTTDLAVGPYSFKLVDAMGCMVDHSFIVYGVAANNQSASYIGLCGVTDSALTYDPGAAGSLTVNRSLQLLIKGIGSWNDQVGVSINWGDGSPATTYTNTLEMMQQTYPSGIPVAHTYTATGVYQITYTYTNIDLSDSGEVVEFISFDSDVYPGDANSDGVANNLDLLNIGLGFNGTGPTRPGASSAWTPQPATDWSQNFLPGLNFKHADCDGNGLIDYPDTLNLITNYGQSHVLSRIGQPHHVFVDPSDPTLAVRFPSGSYPTGSSVSIPITLGDATVQADDVYGIAFTVNYPSNVVDAANVSVDFGNCWLGNLTTLLRLAHNSPSASSVDVAVSRTDHLPVTGFGDICSINIITIDNVSGKLVSTDAYFTLSNVHLIDEMGNELPVRLQGDTVSVSGATGLTAAAEHSSMLVYPNPAKESFFISSPEVIDEVELTDLLGKTVLHTQPNEKDLRISTEQLEKGLYLLRVRAGNETEIRKIEISR
jgi:hypothetical protein